MSFNVINYDINRNQMENYDIIPYLTERYNKATVKPKTFDEFKDFIRKESAYQWSYRTEYEVIISSWPVNKCEEKWDVHKQVLMNIDVITKTLMECLKL